MHPSKDLIHIEKISKSFSVREPATRREIYTEVLADITFPIKRGKFVVLFGPNGCGKTTFLKILAGLEKPDSGCIKFEGKSQQKINIGMVFQNYRDSLLPWKSAIDNVAFPLEVKGISKEKRRMIARKFLNEMGTKIFTESDYDKYLYQLSGGQQQLIAIARSLINKPDILLMDESFAALDHDTRHVLQDILIDLWQTMKFFIVFVSHDVWEAIYLADHVILFSEKPTKVLKVIDIPFPRPRKREIEHLSEFFQLRSKILKVFQGKFYDKTNLA